MFTVGQVALYSQTIAAGGSDRMKVWTGSVWQLGVMKVWNGSAWVPGAPKVWNGSAWV